MSDLVFGAAQIEGPIEYEEGVDRPLVTTFPTETKLEQARPKIENLPSDDELLGRPLVINGKIVPFEEIKRQVCLGPDGVGEIEAFKLMIFVAEEKKRRTDAGAQAELSAEEFDEYMKDIEAELKAEYPEGQVGMDELMNSLATKDPKAKLKANREFEKLFLPDDPAQFPPLTMDAILLQEGGEGVLEYFKTSFEEKLKNGKSTKKNMGERQFDSAILQQVLQHLLSTASIQNAPAAGVLCRVNGVDILIDDVWNEIKPSVTTMEVRDAKQWIVNSTLMREAFEKAGVWPSDEEAEAAYHLHSDPYAGSIFSQERIAVVIKRFPSVERYKEYRRMYEGLLKLKPPSPEELQKHAEFRTNKVIGQVTVDVDVLLCSAFDFKANSWKENGWVDAEKRMKDVLSLLVEEQQPWDVLVEKYSDFYEQPTPLSQRGQEDPNQPKKGRFRNFQRNNLLTQLGESEYWLFLNGTSITDFIFFEQEVQTLGQPMRGPVGWYLPRLMRRTKPPQRLNMDEGTMRDVLLDDYITWHLAQFAQELIQKNEVYGLELPGTAPKKQ
ncbi:MAG: hypothetical protein EXS08_02515 [Planctomycetes bacterium]|nr:hypothetical protein [Planctomycetota bacterium]